MQTELFNVSNQKSVADAIDTLATLKQQGIGSIQNLFVTDESGKFLNSIGLDDLILQKNDVILGDIVKKLPISYSVNTHDSINSVLETIEKYDITSLAVVDKKGYLIGRITHDDAVDAMQKRATQLIYNLNKVDEDEELHESFGKTTRTRSIWLTVNLVNAIIASMVIGIFEETLSAIVALAVLMPIVANMAGTASVQTMTVMVRQMALGQISFHILRPIFIKELNMAVINGLWFGLISTIITQLWFEKIYVSLSIGLSMFVSFVFAGILGTTVPILLKRIGFDPAIASSVIVITLVDIIGFFSFLWFAQMIAL
jgi:magnesium transporter